MITRVRIECSAKTEAGVEGELMDVAKHTLSQQDWEDFEYEDQEILTSAKGYWGRLTMRRKDAS